MDDESVVSSKSKSGGFLSRMRAQAATRAAAAAHTINPPPAIPTSGSTPPAASPVSESTTDPEPATTVTAAREPSPQPSSEQPPPPSIPAQAREPAPATTTVLDITTSLEPVSDLSDLEPEGVSEIPGNSKKKSLARKGKRNVFGQGSEGGPSKHRSGRKKAT